MATAMADMGSTVHQCSSALLLPLQARTMDTRPWKLKSKENSRSALFFFAGCLLGYFLCEIWGIAIDFGRVGVSRTVPFG